MMNNRLNQAFTLVEIMVVVVIVGILLSFAIPQYQQMIEKNNTRKMILDAKTICGAITIYRAKNGKNWPNTGGPLQSFFINDINLNLGLNIQLPSNTNYDCYNTGANGSGVTHCRFDNSSAHLDLQNENPISSTNPTCLNLTSMNVCP